MALSHEESYIIFIFRDMKHYDSILFLAAKHFTVVSTFTMSLYVQDVSGFRSYLVLITNGQ